MTRFEPAIPTMRSGIEPDRFLPAMREAGLDPDVDDWAIDSCVAALKLVARVFGVVIQGELVMNGALPAGLVLRAR